MAITSDIWCFKIYVAELNKSITIATQLYKKKTQKGPIYVCIRWIQSPAIFIPGYCHEFFQIFSSNYCSKAEYRLCSHRFRGVNKPHRWYVPYLEQSLCILYICNQWLYWTITLILLESTGVSSVVNVTK